ncbi:MAG TPA: hypothetical protein VGR45_07735 [Stellaceae bacterium]|nr:hypothetical protein [Stellaceae bacterium]
MRVVIGQAVRAMEDRQAAVGIFVDAHDRAHEMRPQRARRDLQAEAAPFDGVVVADPALFLEAEDLARLAGAVGYEGAARLGRGDREGGVVLPQIAFGDPPVGRLDRRDPGEPQLLRQAVLQRAEGALGAPARLGRISRDVADAKLRCISSDLT